MLASSCTTFPSNQAGEPPRARDRLVDELVPWHASHADLAARETADDSPESVRTRLMDTPLVSVVLSFRNEAENLPTLIARLSAVLVSQEVEYELLFVNDASTDHSLSVLL